ncbi:MAG: zinc dependent phospholipase C family protein [Deltaproteobacteria bacterium]|nr:zinc dependent phospholipase C family protein [Deltaproteobacteria bacterium]
MIRRTLVSTFLFGTFLSSQSFASGNTLHVFMSDTAVDLLKSEDLRKLLLSERDAYRSGTLFPDALYQSSQHSRGEFTHWQGFHNSYLSHILAKCSKGSLTQSGDCRKLFAHFMGTVSHTIGDVNFDRYFVTEVAKRHFRGSNGKAQTYTDFKLEFLATWDWGRGAVFWANFVPTNELAAAYRKAGIAIPPEEINGSAFKLYLLIAVAVKLGSPVMYFVAKREAPWAAENYYSARGGVRDSAEKIAQVWDNFWVALHSGVTTPRFYRKGGWPNFEYGFR